MTWTEGSPHIAPRPLPAGAGVPGGEDQRSVVALPSKASPITIADASAKDGGTAGKAPGKTWVQKALGTILLYACVTPVVFLYERATAPACSSSRVENVVQDILETKTLHVRKFSVALSDVKVLQHDVFGDHRCSAAVVVDGKPISRRVEYHWTTRKNHLDTVYAQLKR